MALLLCAMTTAGCQTQPQHHDAAAPSLPYPDLPNRPRALVYNSPALRNLIRPDARHATYSWYASRNDTRRHTFSGFYPVTHERQHTITYDRQTTIAGKVRDHFTRTARTHRTTETRR